MLKQPIHEWQEETFEKKINNILQISNIFSSRYGIESSACIMRSKVLCQLMNPFLFISSSKWMVSGTGDSMLKNQTYYHPDCPMDGNLLNSQIVSFERLKLTNNERSKNGQVCQIQQS